MTVQFADAVHSIDLAAAVGPRHGRTAKFIAQPVERIDHRGVRLDDAALQLGDVVLGQLGQ